MFRRGAGGGEKGASEDALTAGLSAAGQVFAAAFAGRAPEHPRFRGPPLQAGALTAEDLGALMVLRDRLEATSGAPPAREAAFQLYEALNHRRPRFSAAGAEACLEARRAAAERAAEAAARLNAETAAGARGAGERDPRHDALWALTHQADDLQWRFALVVAATPEPPARLPTLAREILATLERAAELTALRADDPPAALRAFAPHPRAELLLWSVADAAAAAEKRRARYAAAPIALAEAETAAAAPLREHAEMALRHKTTHPNTPTLTDGDCARLTGALAFAEDALARAEAHLAAIHDGRAPYQSDKAFSLEDCDALETAMRLGLAAEAPWAAARIGRLLRRVAIAPGTAKTAPSQSLTHRWGRAVADHPSAAGVLALRETLAEIRHAGLKKKLERLAKDAERKLSERPDFILDLPADAPLPKPLALAAKRAVERLYRRGPSFTLEAWRARFWERKELRALCAKLIWRLEDAAGEGFSARPKAARGALGWRMASGEARAAPESARIRLWHPLSALGEEGEAGLEAWRAALVAEGLKQPFLQAFRQYYPLAEEEAEATASDRFAGHWVGVKALTGAGRSAGWRFDGAVGYVLTWPDAGEGEWGLAFACGAHHPGAEGDAMTGALQLFHRGAGVWRWAARPFSAADPVALSEALRSVDMITAVGARAYDPTGHAEALNNVLTALRGRPGCWNAPCALRYDPPGVQSAELRREALSRLYGAEAAVTVEARQVAVGDYRINIATGRITRNGDPVAPPPAPSRAIWIPFEDTLLGDIVKAVAALRNG